MFNISGNTRIFLHKEPVDMRKSFEGLGFLVETIFHEEVASGAFFVFLNRRKDSMKILYWDVDGLAIWYKRLEKGRFLLCKGEGFLINRRDFFMLLEGITPKILQQRYSLK